MIKIATLPQATEQEVFDQVARHLLTQNKKSMTPGVGCAYRGEEGTKCAAGCLIGDDEYNPKMERKNWIALHQVPDEHSALISMLQSVHDCYDPQAWHERLETIARTKRISTAVLEEFK